MSLERVGRGAPANIIINHDTGSIHINGLLVDLPIDIVEIDEISVTFKFIAPNIRQIGKKDKK